MYNIDLQSRVPIYEQLCEGVKNMLLDGELKPGAKLPSVREMAKQLGVNPNTVTKAFQTLEREKIIYTVPGKGSFCAQFSPQSDPRREELLARLEETVRELRWLGVSEEEIIEKIGGDGNGEH